MNSPCQADDTAAMTESSPQHATLLRAQDYRRMRWKNGAGWTTELLRVPDSDDWRWRLSIAEVEADGPFSVYPGVERELMLLAGNGMRLCFEDGVTQTLSPPRGSLRFAGERPLQAQLLDGPSRDFSVMWKRDEVDARLWCRPLVGAMVLFVEPGETWVFHLLSGHARFSEESGVGRLETGDTAVLRANRRRARYAVDGAGEALLVRVEERGER